MGLRKSLDPMLDSRSEASIADFPMKYQLEWATAAQVFGALLAFSVLGESSRHVGRNARVETSICATQQIDAPGFHHRLMIV